MVSNPEIRAARSFLFSNGIKSVKPSVFASAAKELDVGFKELLRLLGLMQMGGQGQQTQREAVIDEAALKNSQLANEPQ